VRWLCCCALVTQSLRRTRGSGGRLAAVCLPGRRDLQRGVRAASAADCVAMRVLGCHAVEMRAGLLLAVQLAAVWAGMHLL
jgi:hypothetical protein